MASKTKESKKSPACVKKRKLSDISNASDAPKHGQLKCQGKYGSGKNKGEKCKNGAYFSSEGKYLCGSHSRSDKSRTELIKMKKSEKDDIKKTRINDMMTALHMHETVQIPNLVRMKGRHAQVEIHPGRLNVYPNFFATYQGIGLNLPSLSPMSLGPVNHGQPGLPMAKNIENFFQTSKYFSKHETPEEYIVNRLRGYQDSTPHRHKFPNEDSKNRNIPNYFVWIDKHGVEHHLDYITSRQFYCNFYERLVTNHKDFIKLKDYYKKGIKIQICGPDAYDMEIEEIASTYKDPSHPFGHERVLFTMLVEDDSSKWPWRLAKTFDF